MNYSEWIWDFDGTLADSYPAIVRASQYALHAQGVCVPDSEVLALCKRSLGHMRDWYAQQNGLDMEKLKADYRAHTVQQGVSVLTLYDGVVDTLREIIQKGGHNYLYTHRGPSALEALEYHGIASLFTGSVTSADGFPAKPAPDALLHLLHIYSLNPTRCIMMGDRDIDMDAGKNAGIACGLFDPDQYYPDYEATLRFSSYDALRRML